MGFFDRFRKDPTAELDRVEELIGQDDPVKALEIARRVARRADGSVGQRAEALVATSQDALVRSTLERAGTAERQGDLADAAEWVSAALQHVRDETQRSELEARRRSLEEREQSQPAPEPEPEAPAPEPEEFATDPEVAYATLVDMLDDRVAGRWADRPAELREAVVALNEGRAEEARQALEELVGRDPRDPVLRFERGRARLLTDDEAGAREDFEAVWPTFGDLPIDRSGSLSVPTLWAEATLATGDSGSVIERLQELTRPDHPAAAPELLEYLSVALLREERHDEARKVLADAASRFPRQPRFPYLLAQALTGLGEPRLAVHCLETAIAPSCATGNCSAPPMHVPSFRALAHLYLELGESPGRVRELLSLLQMARGGRLGPEELVLKARLHEAEGDDQAAREAREAARRMGEEKVGSEGPAQPLEPTARTPI